MKVLVAGANGILGRLVVAELRQRGIAVRALVRRPAAWLPAFTDDVRVADALAPDGLRGVCDGVDAVFSSLGASVAPSPFAGWRSYTRVDATANGALLQAAQRSGVRRFVYTSLNGGAEARHLDYAEGHERVVDALRRAGIDGAVLRPTGFFAAMCDLVDMARRGVMPLFGDGSARTNPIDERDLAALAAAELTATTSGQRDVPAGGPDVFTRRQIAEMAFAAAGRRPRFLRLPAPLAIGAGHAMRCISPRLGHFFLFAQFVMTHACLAPPVGTRRLADAMQAHTAKR